MPRKAHRRQKSQQYDAQQSQQHDGQHQHQHQQQPHQQQQQQEDYDNNGPSAEIRNLPDVHGAIETIDDMNLRVLRCYEPTIRSIEAVAASSVVYAFNSETSGWIKADPQIEGTLFLCEQEPLVLEQYAFPRACVFVLNRKGLMNVVVDLARVSAAEVMEGLITLGIEDETAVTAGPDGTNGANAPQVLGLWIHGNGTTGSGSGTNGPVFDPNVVVRRWQAIHESMQQTLGTSRLSDTAEILNAASMVSKMALTAQGINPDGIATTAVGPQPSVKEVMAMVLGQTAGHGVAQEGL
ncbi:hypothetical protein Sste5346_003676 [Sporothrix stenoceras]|uniref:Decapping enzyme n=1 Tax=Sporothrix stenoceras TaxID=5173 RepID=A0ABR3ZC57_9PEZI